MYLLYIPCYVLFLLLFFCRCIIEISINLLGNCSTSPKWKENGDVCVFLNECVAVCVRGCVCVCWEVTKIKEDKYSLSITAVQKEGVFRAVLVQTFFFFATFAFSFREECCSVCKCIIFYEMLLYCKYHCEYFCIILIMFVFWSRVVRSLPAAPKNSHLTTDFVCNQLGKPVQTSHKLFPASRQAYSSLFLPVHSVSCLLFPDRCHVFIIPPTHCLYQLQVIV